MCSDLEPEILGRGWSSIVSRYDDCTVLKGYEVWYNGQCCKKITPNESSKKSQAREDAVYQRLGQHPHIPQYHGLVEIAAGVYSLHIELVALGDLRNFIVRTRDYAPPMNIRLKMALQTSLTLAYIHSKSVIHGDISCRNIFVCTDWTIKIGDFGASGIDNAEPLDDVEEIRYELPLRGRTWKERPRMSRELFALGSAIYEIMAWKMPYDNMQDDEVEKNYAEDKFPGTEDLVVGGVISDCWNEKFRRAEDVVSDLKFFGTYCHSCA